MRTAESDRDIEFRGVAGAVHASARREQPPRVGPAVTVRDERQTADLRGEPPVRRRAVCISAGLKVSGTPQHEHPGGCVFEVQGQRDLMHAPH
jgi:hypothetical protein